MQTIVDSVIRLMEILGAPGVAIALFLESVFPPIPSEAILPLAGFTVSQGSFSFISVLGWSTVGSLAGAWLLYGLGAWFGAPRLRKIADKMWLIEASDVDKALGWFNKYGPASVFFGRFIPGVRSLISVPAGVYRMNLWKFTALTTLGSLGWNALLIALGMWLGESYQLVSHYVDQFSTVIYVLLAILLVAGLAVLIRRSQRNRLG